jgi:hypothetical protein
MVTRVSTKRRPPGIHDLDRPSPGPMPSGTYLGAKRAAERGDPLPLVCYCAHDDCVCPDGRHPPPAALALSNKRKAAMASIAERDEEDEDDDEEFWAGLTGPGSLMHHDQGAPL